MNCPVCKRDLAPTLSICLTCGAMMNDSVREELECKVIPSGELRRPTAADASAVQAADRRAISIMIDDDIPTAEDVERETGVRLQSNAAAIAVAAESGAVQTNAADDVIAKSGDQIAAAAAQPVVNSEPRAKRPTADTSDLSIKRTSPTLVEFQAKNQMMPEWRLQLQNAVRQRSGSTAAAEPAAVQTRPQTSGANALKSEPVKRSEKEPAAEPRNERVAAALKRIESSRRTYLTTQTVPRPEPPRTAVPNRSYPFNVVQRAAEMPAKRAELNPSPNPQLINPLRIERRKFDTSKLPPLPVRAEPQFEPPAEKMPLREEEILEKVRQDELEEEMAMTAQEAEDLAPLAMRFNAGLFDLLVGIFASGIVVSPFLMFGGEWFSVSGLITFAAVLSVVMFAYLTAAISYFGRTFGMRLFQLELIDVENSEYPTMHQAAVNSAVYLFSLLLGGVGLLPVFFTEERRGAPDLVAGTVVVREI